MKFVPFSVFILIPGLELLLPAWIAIFPNAIPTQFMSEEKKALKLKETIKNRNRAAEKLLYLFPKHLKTIAGDVEVDKHDKERLEALIDHL